MSATYADSKAQLHGASECGALQIIPGVMREVCRDHGWLTVPRRERLTLAVREHTAARSVKQQQTSEDGSRL